MSLKSRIERVENAIVGADICPQCGAERDPARRLRATEAYAEYREHLEEQEAARLFADDLPELAAALGLDVPPPGVCHFCGADRRLQDEIDASNRRFVGECLDTLAKAGVPADEAIAMVKENAPHLLRFASV